MRKLRLVGLSAGGRQVIYVDDANIEFVAPADDRLRAALRGDRARLGQLEIEMDSVLRPRDIQARIRGGESPEAVAALAGVSVEKIMPFCVPVLAEREHIAELAGRSHVRRKNSEDHARRLVDVVAERLRARGIHPESAKWDAWRRDDGRWSVQASYHSGERERTAEFAFDAVGRYSLADDDEAKWLTGERQATSKGPQPREGGKASERRLAAVPTGADLLTLSPDSYEELADDLTAVVRAVREEDDVAELRELAPPAPEDKDAGAASAHDGEDASALADETPSQSAPARRRKSARRASVPSWDEIMFGRSKDR